jgi:hypothetical protein
MQWHLAIFHQFSPNDEKMGKYVTILESGGHGWGWDGTYAQNSLI